MSIGVTCCIRTGTQSGACAYYTKSRRRTAQLSAEFFLQARHFRKFAQSPPADSPVGGKDFTVGPKGFPCRAPFWFSGGGLHKDLLTFGTGATRPLAQNAARLYTFLSPTHQKPNKAPILKLCAAAHNFKIDIAKEGGI